MAKPSLLPPSLFTERESRRKGKALHSGEEFRTVSFQGREVLCGDTAVDACGKNAHVAFVSRDVQKECLVIMNILGAFEGASSSLVGGDSMIVFFCNLRDVTLFSSPPLSPFPPTLGGGKEGGGELHTTYMLTHHPIYIYRAVCEHAPLLSKTPVQPTPSYFPHHLAGARHSSPLCVSVWERVCLCVEPLAVVCVCVRRRKEQKSPFLPRSQKHTANGTHRETHTGAHTHRVHNNRHTCPRMSAETMEKVV